MPEIWIVTAQRPPLRQRVVNWLGVVLFWLLFWFLVDGALDAIFDRKAPLRPAPDFGSPPADLDKHGAFNPYRGAPTGPDNSTAFDPYRNAPTGAEDSAASPHVVAPSDERN